MQQCDGSIRPGHPTTCENIATWSVCCNNDNCSARFTLCDWHELEARALVIQWNEEGGYCPFCRMKYQSVEHSTARWYRLESDRPTPVPST